MLTNEQTQQLKTALAEYERHLSASLPEEAAPASFSPRHQRRMEKLFARCDRLYYPMIRTRSRRALALAASAAPDAILLVRGGGSYEDLMTFNDEALARAVAACPVPVITGIGHEPDTCICDMVADRRCSTPTAAAESVAPAFDEIATQFHERERRLARAMGATLSAQGQLLDTLQARAQQAYAGRVRELSVRLEALATRRCLQDPAAPLELRRDQLALSEERLHEAMPRMLGQSRRQATELGRRLQDVGPRLTRPYETAVARGAAQLEALSPLKVLARGYAIVRDEAGHVVGSAAQLAVGSEIAVVLGDGGARATVTSTSEGQGHEVATGDAKEV